MMEHPRIDDEKVIDRYLVGSLSPEDEALFEEHLFACADCLQKVQWGEELRRGLRAVAAEDSARAVAAQSLATAGLIAWLRRRGLGSLAGLAMLLVLLPVVVWQQVELRRVREEARATDRGSSFTAPIGNFHVVSLGVVRAAGDDVVEIRPDPTKEAVLLSLELPSADAPSYRVILYGDTGAILWQGDDLEPNLYDTLLIALPSSFLVPGNYRLTVAGSAPAGSLGAGQIELRILPQK